MMDTFSPYRSYLFSIAYRMLGSVMDAEDMVQESYLRWQKSDQAAISSPKSYLATIVTRLCIDQLRSAAAQKETYIGPWLPEPLIVHPGDQGEKMIALAESLSLAFLQLLERLTPVERAIFLLREVFDYGYGEIAHIVNKSEANCRQIFRRARQHINQDRPRFDTSYSEQQRITNEFWAACQEGNLDGIMTLLAEDAVQWSDGGGKVTAARRPIRGADRVARFILGIIRLAPSNLETKPIMANGQPGMVLFLEGHPFGVYILDIRHGRIQNLFSVLNPDKLRHLKDDGPETA